MSSHPPAIFLSYARENAPEVQRIAEALRAAGLEVWFDQNELRGGDAWDRKIRQQIKECSLFVPVISAVTQARAEGYFRLEWKLAVDRSHLMAEDKAFLLPVIIDDTTEAAARVPDRFREVQWTRLPGGTTPHEFSERVKSLLGLMPASVPAKVKTSPTQAPELKPQTPHSTPRRRTPTLVLAVTAIALVGATTWYLRRDRPSPPNAAQPAVVTGQAELHTLLAEGRYAEAERTLALANATTRTPDEFATARTLRLLWKGETEGTLAQLAALNPSAKTVPAVIWTEALTQLLRGDGEKLLSVLTKLPDESWEQHWLHCPKAYLAGWGQRLASREEQARAAWEKALGQVEARSPRASDERQLRLLRAELLALLGRKPEAEAALRAAQSSLAAGQQLPLPPLLQVQAALGRGADAAEALATAKVTTDGWMPTAVWLQLDPRLASIRGETAFQRQVIARARADTQRNDEIFPRDPNLQRALKLVETDGMRGDFDLAEELARNVLQQRPTDPEALTVMARLQVTFLYRGFDISEDRYAMARRQAERAVQLAPDEPEALGTLGIYFLVRRGLELPRAKPLLERAVALKPDSALYRRFLNASLVTRIRQAALKGQEAEALNRATQAKVQLVELFPSDPIVGYELALHQRDIGDAVAMEQTLDRVLSLAPITNVLIWKSRLVMWLRGDLAECKRLLDLITEAGQTYERAIFARWEYAMAANQPEVGLNHLHSFTGTWMEDFNYTGPKGLLTAEMLRLQGKNGVAALELEAALAAIRRERTKTPANLGLSFSEAWALVGLGRIDEAKKLAEAYAEAGIAHPYPLGATSTWWYTLVPFYLLTDQTDRAAALIREGIEALPPAQAEAARISLRNRIQLDPRLAKLRTTAAVQKLLADFR